MPKFSQLIVLVSLTACSGKEPENSPPEITGFAASASTVDDTAPLVISAVLRDADGTDDIVGGTLAGASGAEYGDFVSTGDGTFELELSWAALNSAQAIDLPFGHDDRIFIGTFTDGSGATVSARVEVVLECSAGTGPAICGEEADCVIPGDLENCTECGDNCSSFVIDASYGLDVLPEQGPGCAQEGCWTILQIVEATQTATCDDICAGGGWTCYGAEDNGEAYDCDVSFVAQPASYCGCLKG